MLPDTDAAGILFFGNYIKLAHIIYEEFMENIGFSLCDIIDNAEILILIVHTEADFKKSMHLGDRYELSVKVSKIGNSSFILSYTFTSDNTVTATAETVHVTVDKASNKPVGLSPQLVEQLKQYQ